MAQTKEGLGEGTSAASFGALIDDQEIERREDRKLAAELTQIFNAFDRIFTMMRVYPPTHPLVAELVRVVLGRLEPILERENSVYFNLDAHELQTLRGTPFFSQELAERDQFVWYAAYSDGLLQIEIERGVTDAELRGLLRVINQSAQGTIASDDDTVTLLWEQQNPHIRHFAVEGFVDHGELEDFGERTEKDAIEMIADAAVDPNSEEAAELHRLFDNLNLAHLDLFTRMQIEANAKIIVPELRDQDLAYAFAIPLNLIDQLGDEWRAGADLEYRLIEALLSTIRTAPASVGASRAAEIITAVTRQLLDHEMFEEAVRILELLHDRRELFLDTEIDPLGELIDQLAEPVQIEGLVNLFQLRPDLRQALTRLLKLLGREVLVTQIARLLADPDRKVVAVSELVDILFEAVDDATAHLVTEPGYLDQPIYLKRLMPELVTRDFAAWKPTTVLIHKAIASKDPEVRDLALSLEHPCWDDLELAQQYLVPMANDPDDKIRKLALRMLADKHPAIFKEAISDTVLARKMGNRTHAELRFLMRAFLDSADEGAEFLRSLLEVKGWFGSDATEFAKMAAAILVEAGDMLAVEKIRAAQSSIFTNPELKRSYTQIIQRFGDASLSEASELGEGS